MPSALPCVFLFLAIAVFYTVLGLAVARAVAPRGVAALGMAPPLGWALHSVVALGLLSVTGFSGAVLGGASVVGFVAALVALWRGPGARERLPGWGVGLAAAMGLLPAMALLPKYVAGGVVLGPPIFDHVKIAVVDAILRDGLPVTNPFFGPIGTGHLAYYYLWHFSVAGLASVGGLGAWTAEIAMTAFTGFAAIMLVMALAVAVGGRRGAAVAAGFLCLPGSMRTLLVWALGSEGGHRLIPREADIGGWLNQAAWVPQHLASACCLILAVLLLLHLAQSRARVGGVAVAALGLVVAAGFESSAWIGAIAFAVAGTAVACVLLWRMERARLGWFVARVAAGAVLAVAVIAPFAAAEAASIAARAGGAPVALLPYPALGKALPAWWRMALSVPAFWLILLPFDLPAIALPGAAGIWQAVRARVEPERRALAVCLAVALGACLCVAGLLRSTIDNNDLGWRAALPAVLLLAAFAGAFLAEALAVGRWRRVGAVLAGAALGVPQMLGMLNMYAFGFLPGDPAGMAAAPALWQAVRQVAGPDERVASNPLYLRDATPWPVNISWALFADRPSCYAGWPTVIAYGAVPRATIEATRDRFVRVFAGNAAPGDVAAMAREDDCAVAVLAPGDGAWARDPFAGSAAFVAVAETDAYRIYRRTDGK